ncbi:MAG: hypothetical protein HY814_13740 [Candidatus Riflebacteria bacterium]|nr:hypothetical protein [Candidatus Riflebacteria bacterium]
MPRTVDRRACCRLVSSGRRFLAFSLAPLSGERHDAGLLLQTSPSGASGPWSVSPLPTATWEGLVGELDAAAEGGLVVVLSASECELHVLLSRDGGATFQELPPPLPRDSMTREAAVAISGGTVYTVSVPQGLDLGRVNQAPQMVFARLDASGRWESLGSPRMPLCKPRSVRLFALEERLLVVRLDDMAGIVAATHPLPRAPAPR